MLRLPDRLRRRRLPARTPRAGRLALLVLFAGCNRGPVRISAGDGALDAGITPPPDSADDGKRRTDPQPDGPCDPLALLARIPTEIPGWVAEDEPIYPYEAIGGDFVGGVGRLYRNPSGRCAIVAVGRPADAAAAAKTLAEERLVAGRRRGTTTLSRRAPEANQVTTWAFPPDGTVLWVRAFGTTDPAMLDPFLDALLPMAGADRIPATEFHGAAPEKCPPTAPFADVYDPGAFYSPPGDCWRP